jgi:hypothetical protein
MTPAVYIPLGEYRQLDKEQQLLLDKLYELPDGLDMDIIQKIATLIKHNKYPWGCSRLIWIPKPGTFHLWFFFLPLFLPEANETEANETKKGHSPSPPTQIEWYKWYKKP